MKEPSSVGHPRQSIVWNYFVHDPGTNQRVCQVEVTKDHGDQGGPSRETSGTAIVAKYLTNLKQHLCTLKSPCPVSRSTCKRKGD